jgi:hypothetical protein
MSEIENQFHVNLMKRLLMVAICLCSPLVANAELAFKEIRTASKDVLVAYFKSTVIDANEVNTTNLATWTLNGAPRGGHQQVRHRGRCLRSPLSLFPGAHAGQP